MKLTLEIFSAAITVLQANTVEEVNNSLETMNAHLLALEERYVEHLNLLTRSFVFFKKYNANMMERKININKFDLATWVPLFSTYKEANVFPDVKADTITKIANAKKEIDKIDFSVSELKLRLKELASNVRMLQGEITKARTQQFILQHAVEISKFFNELNYDAKEIAEFEHPKYFDLYRKGGVLIG